MPPKSSTRAPGPNPSPEVLTATLLASFTAQLKRLRTSSAVLAALADEGGKTHRQERRIGQERDRDGSSGDGARGAVRLAEEFSRNRQCS